MEFFVQKSAILEDLPKFPIVLNSNICMSNSTWVKKNMWPRLLFHLSNGKNMCSLLFGAVCDSNLI